MTHTCTYKYQPSGKDELVIEFDYQPAEPQTWDDPGCDAEVDVAAVYAGGIDILEWCSDVSIEFFAEKALESVASIKEAAEYDRGQDRYEDRMAA